jgi:hypothetical protein
MTGKTSILTGKFNNALVMMTGVPCRFISRPAYTVAAVLDNDHTDPNLNNSLPFFVLCSQHVMI